MSAVALAVPALTERRRLVMATARGFLGTPWRHQGRLPGVALDCLGVIVLAARAAGYLASYEGPAYGRVPHGGTLLRELRRHLEPRSIATMRPGDVVAMAFRQEPMHVGIVGDAGASRRSLIHSYADVGRVVEHEFDATWLSYVARAGVFAFPSIDDEVP